MSKILIITDQHFGSRGDSDIVGDHQERFYEEVCIPYIKKHDIKQVLDLGDTFDRRKYINFKTLQRSKRCWFDPLRDMSIKLTSIVGNHTAFYKNTNDLNTMELFFDDYDNIDIIVRPKVIVVDGLEILMVPWICADTFGETMELLKLSTVDVLFGHLEIAGFEMYRGSVSDGGFDKKLFNRFGTVLSGHYHHKSTNGNINYLGAPYEMTWSDYDDPRGFHVFDTETHELEFIQNPLRLFQKIGYDDRGKTLEDVVNVDVAYLAGAYVKLVVRNKDNPYWLDLLVDKIEAVGVADLQVIEMDYLNMGDIENIDEASESTIDIIRKYANSYMNEREPEQLVALNELLTSLYNEAIMMESDLV